MHLGLNKAWVAFIGTVYTFYSIVRNKSIQETLQALSQEKSKDMNVSKNPFNCIIPSICILYLENMPIQA